MGWQIIKALFEVGLPVGILSFLLVSWSLKTGRLTGKGDHKSQRAEIKAMRKTQKVKKTKTKNPVHNKWLKFGGGFYGAVGLYTFLIIEIGEIRDFIGGYEGVDAAMSELGNASFIDMAISFFINSLVNFIWAVAWPGFWAPNIQGNYIMLWLGVAYGGYWMGMKLARKKTPIPVSEEDLT